MQIGLYFGSFNPIHTGHCIIASHICDNTNLQQVWFIVSPQNPFKSTSSLLNEYHRLHLVKLAIEGDKRLVASDIEFKLPRPSYTIDTLAYLREKYPSNQFSLIVGSDSFQNMHKWKNGEIILKDYQIYVYTRPGSSFNDPQGSNIFKVNAPLLEISSTDIRASIKAGKSVRYLLPDAVRIEIENTGYYNR